MKQLISVCLILSVLGFIQAHSQPPLNSGEQYGDWYRSLTIPPNPNDPYSGQSCCSVADCRPTDYKQEGDHYVVRIPADIDGEKGDKWLAVPPDKILERIDNPTGRGVVCYTPARGIMCFVRTAEG